MLFSVVSMAAVVLKEQSPASQAARVRRYDYACIAKGQVFVAPAWLSEELLQALQLDIRTLLRNAQLNDADEPIGKRKKLDLFPHRWSVPGEAEPSEARSTARRLIDTLRCELENVVGRRLVMDEMGAQAKYSIGKVGEPIHLHIDTRHEALAEGGPDPNVHETTRRGLAWLLYLSDEDWGEPGGSGSGGILQAYPRHDSAGPCGSYRGCLQVGWLERG